MSLIISNIVERVFTKQAGKDVCEFVLIIDWLINWLR